MALLSTKTHVPPLTSNLVARPQLFSSLDTLLQPGYKIAIVSAPAGFGKTTLVSQWLRTVPSSFRISWYSVDENDNTLIRFFSYIIAALNNADPSIGVDFFELAEAHPDLTADELTSYMLNQIAASPVNLLLVIDDTHFITSPDIHQALAMLINHLPANLRLVLAGRVDPSMPLARLRARGQLVEIRTQDLRFNVDETQTLLKHTGRLTNPDNSIAEVLNRSTEGWAAGLQMTILALHSEMQQKGGEPEEILNWFDRELNGSHRYILDYLVEEVLNGKPQKVRDFLLRTCMLERFNAELCTALYVEGASVAELQSMLEDLEHANLFIIPLDNHREWYRYHHLFADMLKKQLLHLHPGLEAELHRRAAHWFEQHKMIDEAIKHAYQTKEVAFAQMLVEKYTLDFILRGQITTAMRWLDGFSNEVLLSSPRLCLNRAWALTFTSKTEAAAPILQQTEVLLRNNNEPSSSLKSEIYGLQSFQKSIYGETTEAIHLAQLALKHSPIENTFLQCSSRLFLAIALVRNGKINEAMQTYQLLQSTCKDEDGLAGLAMLEADFLQFTAVYLNSRGETKQAIQLLKEAIRTFENSVTGNRMAATIYLYVGLGKILYTGNQLEEAESTLKVGLSIDSLSLSLAAIDGWLTLWWVKIGQKDYNAARTILNNLESAVKHCDEKIKRLVFLPAALQDLLEGNIPSSADRLKQLGFSDDVEAALANVSDSELMSWRANEYFVYARLLAAQGKSELGLQVLNRMAQAAETFGLDWVLYRTWITQAAIYYHDQQEEIAMEITAKLLEKTAQSVFGAVQIYLSTGEPARSLLLEAKRRSFQPEHVNNLLAAFPAQPPPEAIPNSPETLSEREIEVLTLMAEGLKNQEIADRLVVSLNTVRYHSKNIFGKLGVDNRTAAVAHAREMYLFK